MKNKKVIGFHDPCFGNRKFPIDMAGFAINLNYLKEKPNASMPFIKFFEESMFLESLDLQFEEIGKKCSNSYINHSFYLYAQQARKFKKSRQKKLMKS